MRYAKIDIGQAVPQQVSAIIESAAPLNDPHYIDVSGDQAIDTRSWFLVGTGFIAAPPSKHHQWNGTTWLEDAGLLAQQATKQTATLCARIDTAADAARAAVVGDPLRAVEYERAASEAQSFADAGYQGDVPPMVAAWAISGRTTQQAAEDILREAAQYDGAIVQLRTLRLEAKELIRAAMSEGNAELAENIAAEAITAIEAAVAGIGNNI